MGEQLAGIRLITRADDAGSAETADRAVLETIERGIVRNVSLMAAGPSIAHAAELLAGRRDICFGLHVTLNAEWSHVRWGPVAPRDAVRSLTEGDSGMFTETPHAFRDRPPVLEEAMTELQAQLDKLRGLGFTISYADSHMGFEWAFPEISEPFRRWCEREGIRHYKAYGRPLPKPEDGQSAAATDPVARIIAGLKRAEPGQYLAVGHPGYDDEGMRRLGSPAYPSEKVVADRIRERLMFTHPDVLACCKELGVRPIRYDEAEPVA